MKHTKRLTKTVPTALAVLRCDPVATVAYAGDDVLPDHAVTHIRNCPLCLDSVRRVVDLWERPQSAVPLAFLLMTATRALRTEDGVAIRVANGMTGRLRLATGPPGYERLLLNVAGTDIVEATIDSNGEITPLHGSNGLLEALLPDGVVQHPGRRLLLRLRLPA